MAPVADGKDGPDGAGAAPDPSFPGTRRVSPPQSGFGQALRRFDEMIGRIELAAVGVFLVALVGVGGLQVLATHLFGKSFVWSFEVVRYSMLCIAMTGAAMAAQTDRQLAMDFLSRKLPVRVRAWMRIVLRLFTASMCLFIGIGAELVRRATAEEHVYELIPPHIGLLAVPIGAALIGLHMIIHSTIDLDYFLRGRLPPEPEHTGH
jgi:TRAP-type C4-dicarboxylate transport system permease small subunit